MKKILLVVIALANFIIAGFSVSILSAGRLSVPLAILTVLAHVAGLFFVERQFLKRQWTGRVKFWLIATLPSVLLSAMGFVAVIVLANMDFFTGYYAGLAQFLVAFCAIIYSIHLFALVGITQLFINKTVKTNLQ